jgi:hypothetical protein
VIVERALRKKPDERFASAAEMAHALAAAEVDPSAVDSASPALT